MTYVLDAAVVLLFVLAVYIGHRRGFIKTVAGIAAFAVALVVASVLAAPLAGWTYDTFVEPSLVTALEEQMTAAGSNISAQIGAAYDAMPSLVQNLLAQFGVVDAGALEQLVWAGREEMSSSPTYLVFDAVRSVLLPFVEALCSLVLFFMTNILAAILLRALDVVAKLPLLKQVNKTLGVVGGIVSGALWVLVAVTVIQVVAAFAAPTDAINLTVVNDTLLVSRLAEINPLGGTLLELIK